MLTTALVYFSILLITVLLFGLYNIRFKFGKIIIHEQNCFDVISVICISLPIILTMSIRYGIGTDYNNYLRIYNNFISTGRSSLEIGYQFLMKLSNWLFGDFQGVLFVASLLTVVPIIVWTLKMKEDTRILTFVIVFCLYFGIWQNLIRQSIAISLFICSIKQIERRCLWKYILLLIIGSCFHTSCLFMIPCYFFIDGKVQKQNGTRYTARYILKIASLLFAIILAAFMFLKFGQAMGVEYAGYIGIEAGGTTRYYLRFAFILAIPELIFMQKMVAKDKLYELYYLLVIGEIVILFFGLYVSYGFRLAQYFSFAHAFLIPEIGRTIKSKRNRIIWNLIMVTILIFRFTIFNLVFGYDGIVPYQTMF